MSDKTALAVELNAALAAGDGDQLAKAAQALDRHVFDLDMFPTELFEAVLAVLASPHLRALPDSLPLVKMFEYKIDLLNPEQRDALGQSLLSALPQLSDETAASRRRSVVRPVAGLTAVVCALSSFLPGGL